MAYITKHPCFCTTPCFDFTSISPVLVFYFSRPKFHILYASYIFRCRLSWVLNFLYPGRLMWNIKIIANIQKGIILYFIILIICDFYRLYFIETWGIHTDMASIRLLMWPIAAVCFIITWNMYIFSIRIDRVYFRTCCKVAVKTVFFFTGNEASVYPSDIYFFSTDIAVGNTDFSLPIGIYRNYSRSVFEHHDRWR